MKGGLLRCRLEEGERGIDQQAWPDTELLKAAAS